jgi:hypothetical protein
MTADGPAVVGSPVVIDRRYSDTIPANEKLTRRWDMRRILLVAMLLSLALATSAFPQSSNATLGGTVADSTGALIPGVSVIATNTATGIVTMSITNETGAYQFAALQPGNYKVSAELSGFQTQTYNEVALGISQQVRLNFRLQVGGVAQSIEVAVAADTLIATTSASVGTVLPEYKVRDLPLFNRDVLGLVGTTTANVRGTGGNITFAGAPTGTINTTRDGISVQQGRYNNGVYASTYTSTDLVEEVRVIVTPADAETGRGSGQVQMRTRSGTNDFRGSAFWTDRNSVLDANTFSNNFNGVKRNYLNRNQFGARLGGPIRKNQTFFFFLYEGSRTIEKTVVTTPVLTQQARQGIYRFFPGVQSAPTDAANPTVDLAGNPVAPRGATGALQSFNVFSRDPLRPVPDPSGMVQRLLAIMPMPNDFTSAGGTNVDGLNLAGYRFVRRGIGSENFQGLGQNINRNQVNLRLDHQFSANHKLNAVASRERTWADTDVAAWPNGINGSLKRQPQVYTASFVSTLSPTLLNEFRFGLRRDRLNWLKPYDLGGPLEDEAKKWLGKSSTGYPFILRPTLFANNIVSYNGNGGVHNVNPLWTYGDNISWTRNKHAFKGGAEIRRGASNEWTAQSTIPRVDLGPSPNAGGRQYPCASCGLSVQGIDNTFFPGLQNSDAQKARDILTDLAGSVGSINQQFDVLDPRNIVFEDYATSYPKRWDDIHQNEFSAFFKDDWKVRPDLTVNLGMRYDWYGVPWEGHGLGAGVAGGGYGIFGLSGRSWSDWLRPGIRGELTATEFVGKKSPNPNKQLYPDDYNNFGPAVGLSWSLPWGEKDKTVLRAGYGVFYQGMLAGGAGLQLDFAIGYFPGFSQIATHQSTVSRELGVRNVVLPIPERLPSGKLPVIPVDQPVTGSNVFAFDPHLVNPYIQNFNLELQRELMPSLTLEVRYIGTKGTKLYPPGSFAININTPNVFENRILDAFTTTRNGGNAILFDDMLRGFNLGSGVINGTTVTGSASLRSSSATRGFLANGDPTGLALYLSRTAPAGGKVGDYIRTNGFPENFVVTNPQFPSGGNSALLWTNAFNSTYHSLNISVTKRLSHGFTNQTTYTWSRALGTNLINPRERGSKGLVNNHRTHDVRSNGSWELPFGPDRPLLANAPGWLSRVVERWQLGGILSLSSGAPLTIHTGLNNPYGLVNNFPEMVTALPKDFGKVQTKGQSPGVIPYFEGVQQINDPIRSGITTAQGLQGSSTNLAITDAQGRILFQNPSVGKIGNLGDNYFEGPGNVNLDANLVKRVKIAETKEFEIRVDAINVLNHPNWAGNNNFGNNNANLSINSTNFGRLALPTTGNRQFIFNARVNF